MVSDLRIFVWIVVIAISIVFGNLALDSGSQAGRGYGFSSLGAETVDQEKEDGEEKGGGDDDDEEEEPRRRFRTSFLGARARIFAEPWDSEEDPPEETRFFFFFFFLVGV